MEEREEGRKEMEKGWELTAGREGEVAVIMFSCVYWGQMDLGGHRVLAAFRAEQSGAGLNWTVDKNNHWSRQQRKDKPTKLAPKAHMQPVLCSTTKQKMKYTTVCIMKHANEQHILSRFHTLFDCLQQTRVQFQLSPAALSSHCTTGSEEPIINTSTTMNTRGSCLP